MASLIPSIPPADGSRPGLLTHLAQVIGGVKTFLGLIVASAGIQLSQLFNTNGTGSTDVVIKAGTSLADASVNAAAALFAVKTGIGGTEADNFRVIKRGILIGNGASSVSLTTVEGSYILDVGNIRAATLNSTAYLGCSVGGVFRFYTDGTQFGRVDQSGTDSTGSPGNATINRPIGISAIAAGASSVTITNSLVTANSHIVISPKNRDATCKELIWSAAAGSFTVSGTGNATAALAFSWEVKGLI